ncbi:MAG TPA: hypothetical protein VK735_16675 [Pseudonocardia sp.]|uniref:hypothetical protein n=1 Tax=Pseudonocardia sp. TaxID=60912 RepID=UPI002CCF39FF|nr:hypothetical protein [Pseudonocardia sp.]HTF49081.1 hypothetical protein [Pseudonocardia sp.]
MTDCLLEPAIAAMLQRSFHTLPHYWPDELERTAEHLEADGYRVTTGLDAPPDPRTLARWGRGPIGGLRPAQPRPIIRTCVRISRGSGSGRRRRRRPSPASPRPPRCPTPTRCGSIYQLHYADGRPQPVIFNEQLVPFYALQPRTDKIPLGGPR